MWKALKKFGFFLVVLIITVVIFGIIYLDKKSKQDVLEYALKLRSSGKILSTEEVMNIVKKYDFFDSAWNKEVPGFDNQFEVQTIKGDKIVRDRALGLIWQHGGSNVAMTYDKAKQWIRELNQKGYAGYHDWRLPTSEEAMSLVEPIKNESDLYIDLMFNKQQMMIWTSDLVKDEPWSWFICFDEGGCRNASLYKNSSIYASYVRAVRSLQKS
jgi:hypothetical protein